MSGTPSAHTKGPPRRMRVLLISPGKVGGVVSMLSQERDWAEAFGLKPPLALLYIGTTLRDVGGHEVRVFDCSPLRTTPEQVARIAEDWRPDIIGISVETFYYYPGLEVARAVSRACPDAFLVMGGPHVGIYPEQTLANDFVDAVVAGDGEEPMLALCEMVATADFSRDIAGLHLRSRGVSAVGRFSSIGDVGRLPIPDRRLLPASELYGSVFSRTGRATTMVSTRGCPSLCGFCKLDDLMNYSARPADKVVAEFRHLAEVGFQEVELYDDTFSIRRPRVREICEGLIEADLGLQWSVRDRVNTLTQENVELMARAGCNRIHFGIESGVERTLAKMKKQISPDKARNAVRYAKAAGLTVCTHFIIGYLDETADEMKQTIEFALELDADFAEFSILVPLPATPVYTEGIERGLWGDFWAGFAANPTAGFQPEYNLEVMGLDALSALRDYGIRRFYFRPRYIARRLATLRSPGELKRQAKMGLNLLGGIVQGGVERGLSVLGNR